ncbi:hypothetical protein [Bradyrhizobium jicamae]|uniref:hypothetical protein n=1 Tax=Bradyrhizobium jicamae TaxID=280332 RepID=UPI000A8413B2|nr:hypothetical protein [Bradyrhizobium jicamae]
MQGKQLGNSKLVTAATKPDKILPPILQKLAKGHFVRRDAADAYHLPTQARRAAG